MLEHHQRHDVALRRRRLAGEQLRRRIGGLAQLRPVVNAFQLFALDHQPKVEQQGPQAGEVRVKVKAAAMVPACPSATVTSPIRSRGALGSGQMPSLIRTETLLP